MEPEREFLISRALAVFNRKYRKNIKVEECDIWSISTDIHSDRAYEIITPNASEFFRIRFFFKFSNYDRSGDVRLEVAQPYGHATLGDEVYVIRSEVDNNLLGVNGYQFEWIASSILPQGVIVTEDRIPIMTENGRFTVLEGY